MLRPTAAALALASVATLAPSSATAADVTLEQLLGAPYVDQLTTSAGGDRLAWVVDAAGRRSIWVATGPTLAPRALVAGHDDDGRSLAEVGFSGDGALLAYTRGLEPAHDESAPNPTHDPNGASVDIWIAPVAGGAPYRVGDGRSPALSPDGKQLAFIRGGQLHVASGARFASDRAVKVRGHAESPRWSPDGSAVAFGLDRGDHAWVAVYRPRDQRLTYMAPDFGRDFAFRW